jgi:DNA-binding transcriptional LysR family regulator
MQRLGISAAPGLFRLRTDDQAAYWHMVVAGMGIGGNQCSVGEAEPRVLRVLPELALPALPLWLTCHEDLHTSLLIRRVFDFLVEALGRPAEEQTDGKK